MKKTSKTKNRIRLNSPELLFPDGTPNNKKKFYFIAFAFVIFSQRVFAAMYVNYKAIALLFIYVSQLTWAHEIKFSAQSNIKTYQSIWITWASQDKYFLRDKYKKHIFFSSWGKLTRLKQ